MAGLNVPSNLRHFAQVQASGYSPALHRKKSSGLLSNSGRLLNWMTDSTAPPAAAIYKDKEFLGSQESAFQHDRPSTDAPQSILVRPDSNKSNIDKVTSFSCLLCVETFVHVPHMSFFYPLSQQSQCDSLRMRTHHLWDLGPPPGHRGLRFPPTATTGLLPWKYGPLLSPWEEMDRG